MFGPSLSDFDHHYVHAWMSLRSVLSGPGGETRFTIDTLFVRSDRAKKANSKTPSVRTESLRASLLSPCVFASGPFHFTWFHILAYFSLSPLPRSMLCSTPKAPDFAACYISGGFSQEPVNFSRLCFYICITFLCQTETLLWIFIWSIVNWWPRFIYVVASLERVVFPSKLLVSLTVVKVFMNNLI